MKNAEPYQDTSFKPPNSSVIFGIAVATIVYPVIVRARGNRLHIAVYLPCPGQPGKQK
jgi:hypothetical protein